MANAIFNTFKRDIANGTIDLDGDTIKVMLVDNTFTPDVDAHEFIDAVSAAEVSGTGYTAGGATLAGKTVTVDDTNNRALFDADDVVWADATITARGAVLYKDTGTPSTSPLVCYIDFGSDISSTAADFTLAFNAAGILALT